MEVGPKINILRYPGGKQRYLSNFIDYLPQTLLDKARYIEPFVGGGSVYFAINPKRAILSDQNAELIDLYRGIRRHPKKVWKIYQSFPNSKRGYYKIRDTTLGNSTLAFKAARTLYLNRTCFKGMWRHNAKGKFNVGYGGQSRRWVINADSLVGVSNRLKKAKLIRSDFEPIVDQAQRGDFLFLDPPYTPGSPALRNSHFQFNSFSFDDHKRLAQSLRRANKRGVRWTMTTSSHPDVIALFKNYNIILFAVGVGKLPGARIRKNIGEVLISNWRVR